MKTNTGILLTNIGSPDAPLPSAVRRYLAEFLTDPRVIELPRLLWYPVLYGFILPFRSRRSAALYRRIWTEAGSPLKTISQNIAEKLSLSVDLPVAVGMHYGSPSIADAMHTLQTHKIRQLIILPLYPQYSATTTASSFDLIAKVLRQWREVPALRLIQDYADHPHYIDAICAQIRAAWQRSGKKFLLLSYHGIPSRYVEMGDPYPARCHLTTEKIVQTLGLTANEYCHTFQSRLGPTEWLQPYTDETLKALPGRGIKDIQVICPGFSADCLETLEEIAISGEEQFLESGGTSFEYIPALNDSTHQIRLLSELITQPA